MNPFTLLLTNLQAVIAAKAARDRALTVLLAALWARVARMATRLARLVALWRAGKLPKARAPRIAGVRIDAQRSKPRVRFPNTPGWLRRKLGYEVGAFGTQLQHVLTQAECQAFLAACPQAGRILRPLLRMLTADPLPEAVTRQVTAVVPAPQAAMVGVVLAPVSHFLNA